MKQNIILDTGVLVAFLSVRDNHHFWAKAILKEISKPLLTCEAVLTEACFLLRTHDRGRQEIMKLVKQGYIQVPFCLSDEIDAVSLLMQSYQDVPISLADACLVRMTEIYADNSVLTLDSDFRIYRKHRNQEISVIITDLKS
jgi:uncharacterized protein